MDKATRQRPGGSRRASWLFLAVLLLAGAVRAQVPVVSSADPPVTDQGTTLDVTISGSGFEKGARAAFYVTGTSDPGGVTVNSTTYKTSSKLLANLTVAPNAAVSKFDVAVELRDGRRGVGMEKFSVKKGPTGTIYYRFGSTVYRMAAADGSNKTSLGIPTSKPSLLLHGGRHWFLLLQAVPGEINSRGLQRYDLYARREDGAMSVRLTDDPTLDYKSASVVGFIWAPDEGATSATVSWLGWRWSTDGTFQVPGSGGIYKATVLFNAAGDVIGLAAPPAFLVSVGVKPPDGVRTEIPDALGFSWSPDMASVVADRDRPNEGSHELRIVAVATGSSTTLLQDPIIEVSNPDWSPNGSKIAFQSIRSKPDKRAIETISPAGGGRTVLISEQSDVPGEPRWSPDSAYLVYTLWLFGGTGNADIYRISASGSGNPNLTGDIGGQAFSLGWR